MNEHLTFVRSGGGRFQFDPAVVETMQRYLQATPDTPESGGVLLGRHIIGTQNIVVDQVTTPLPGDCQSRVRFFRARRQHQVRIDQAWQESGRTCTYLGEWHTHPEPHPVPSVIDWLE